jgi:hypothetical protein
VDQPGYSFSTPAEEGSAIYIAEDQDRQFCIDNCGPRKHYSDYLLKLDSRTGQQLSKIALGEDGPSQLVLQDGILYYSTSASNTVKAVDASTGRQIWEFGFGIEDAPPNEITLTDHALFFGVFNGFLYALELPGYPSPVLPASTP